jgi:hypothetical protein
MAKPARDIIEAVVDNMRANIEPLKYSLLAPSRYLVYLHPSEHARLEGILPEIVDEIVRALTEALAAMNTPSRIKRFVRRLSREKSPVARTAGPAWDIEILADADGELEEGGILIDSILVLPARPDLGVGERTRRIRTTRIGGTTTVEAPVEETVRASTSTARIHARITFTDSAGAQTFEMKKDSISLGRGGKTFPVDLRIRTSEDVSREHARIRRDPQTGAFYLIDLSKLGTTINGQPASKDETALPDDAQIGLADTVVLTFNRVR